MWIPIVWSSRHPSSWPPQADCIPSSRAFAPPELPGFDATTTPLTPAGHCLTPDRSLCFICLTFRPFHLQPPDCSHDRFNTLPLSVMSFPQCQTLLHCRSGLHHKRAGSPDSPAESSSLKLRTGRSPPVASHPASRRRSYLQIQAGERLPEEDLHLSDQTNSQTHPRVPPAQWLRATRATRGRRGSATSHSSDTSLVAVLAEDRCV